MRSKEVDEAIDMLQNCIADYVIGDFCVGKYCPMENECKDKDCPFNTAIDKVVAYISELEEENKKQRGQLNSAFDNGFIHKDKIRDKIEHCESIKDVVDNGTYTFEQVQEVIISVLKELLGE